MNRFDELISAFKEAKAAEKERKANFWVILAAILIAAAVIAVAVYAVYKFTRPKFDDDDFDFDNDDDFDDFFEDEEDEPVSFEEPINKSETLFEDESVKK